METTFWDYLETMKIFWPFWLILPVWIYMIYVQTKQQWMEMDEEICRKIMKE